MMDFVRETFKKFYSSDTSWHSVKSLHFVVAEGVVDFVEDFVVDIVVSDSVVIAVVVNVSIHRVTPILIACAVEYAKE